MQQPEAITLPANIEAERALLGCYALKCQNLLKSLEFIPPDALARFYWDGCKRVDTAKRTIQGDSEPLFHDAKHQEIFEIMLDLHADGTPFDLVILSSAMDDRGVYERIGGAGFLASLEEDLMTDLFLAEYARIVAEKWRGRRLVKLTARASRLASDPLQDARETLIDVRRKIIALEASTVQSQQQSVGEAAIEMLEQIEKRRSNPKRLAGIETGFKRIDDTLSGLLPGNFYLIGGRPSVGKSAAGLQIANHTGINLKLPTLYLTIEMSTEMQMVRLLAMRTGIHASKIRDCRLNDWEADEIARVTNAVQESPLWFDATPGMTLDEIQSTILRRKLQNRDLALVIVDYLQLARIQGAKDRRLEVTAISHGLKSIAREVNVPLIAICALSRAEKGKDDEPPKLRDLKETGDLEYDADVVMFVHRANLQDRMAQFIVAKHRNGALLDIDMIFDGPLMTFREMTD